MDNIRFRDIAADPSEAFTLKRIFDIYNQETITEEQVQRVLGPILKMIEEGKFDEAVRR